MSKCFADKGEECYALKVKNCDGCAFFKTQEQAIAAIEATENFKADKELQKIRDDFAK